MSGGGSRAWDGGRSHSDLSLPGDALSEARARPQVRLGQMNPVPRQAFSGGLGASQDTACGAGGQTRLCPGVDGALRPHAGWRKSSRRRLRFSCCVAGHLADSPRKI